MSQFGKTLVILEVLLFTRSQNSYLIGTLTIKIKIWKCPQFCDMLPCPLTIWWGSASAIMQHYFFLRKSYPFLAPLIDSFGWNVLNRTPYSPDLASSDFYLFTSLSSLKVDIGRTNNWRGWSLDKLTSFIFRTCLIQHGLDECSFWKVKISSFRTNRLKKERRWTSGRPSIQSDVDKLKLT